MSILARNRYAHNDHPVVKYKKINARLWSLWG